MTAILSLGMFVFSVPTLSYQELQRSWDFRYAMNPRIGARDAPQFLGAGDETVTLTGTVYAEMGDIEASIDQLAKLGAEGQALPLVCANGRVYGTYVITSLGEQQRAHWPDGTPRAIAFGLDLLRVDDSPASSNKAGISPGKP